MEPTVLVNQFGDFPRAVAAVSSLSGSLWQLAFGPERTDSSSDNYLKIDESYFLEILQSNLTGPEDSVREHAVVLLSALLDTPFCSRADGNQIRLPLIALQPLWLARELLKGVRPDHELRYFTMRSLRQASECVFSSQVAHVFHLLSTTLSSRIAAADNARKGQRPTGRQLLNYSRDVAAPLRQALLERRRVPESSVDVFFKLFIDCCRAVGYLRASYRRHGSVLANTQQIDADYLLSRLFGMPTDLDGFDALFGGGGIILPDVIVPGGNPIGGRAVLTIGRYATGKSLLSLRMAVEVARKGGVAWVMPMEQSPEECLYAMESTSPLLNDDSMVVVADAISAQEVLNRPQGSRGALIFLRTIKESFDQFVMTFPENVASMEKYPLRLIVVDPVNSIYRDREDHTGELRSKTMKLFEEAKRQGTNVWLIAEEGSDPKNELLYEQNIADTVIRLSLHEDQGYTQRYIEVTKSRLQREQRGRHPYSIRSGSSIRVFPSSAAVSARIRARSVRPADQYEPFGLRSLDEVLGKDAIAHGDVVVMQGDPGTLKSHLGLVFLLWTDLKRKESSGGEAYATPSRNLLVSTRDSDPDLRRLLGGPVFKQRLSTFQKTHELGFCPLPTGYVVPGRVLQLIEDEFVAARLANSRIDRVMVDNVAHWDMSCPYIRQDQTFADTLVDLLRTREATSLFISGAPSRYSDSGLQRSILARADCLIHFDRIEYRGVYRAMCRVLKTRNKIHRPESFEIVLGHDSIDLESTSSLLRVGPDGEVNPVKIHLFLNQGSEAQKSYGESFQTALKAVLSQDAKIEGQSRYHRAQALALGTSSAVDELQVVQLDEFEVPNPNPNSFATGNLHRFANSDWDANEWGDLLERLKDRVKTPGGFVAVPYYTNVGLLVHRPTVSPEACRSWKSLAAECQRWERENPDKGSVFFDFPETEFESYNSLFLEIFLSLRRPLLGSSRCGLREWLQTPEAVEASVIFWQLCNRSYTLRPEAQLGLRASRESLAVNPQASVWRVWYSSLSQLIGEMKVKHGQDLQVSPLPGGISVAGEWFLGVPSYSAAPDVALNIIKLLTTYQSEIERFRNGIGLPTKERFYRSDALLRASLSRYCSFEVRGLSKIVQDAFPRSSFDCYGQVSALLASHLQAIIDLPSEDRVRAEAKNLLSNLDVQVGAGRAEHRCRACPAGPRPVSTKLSSIGQAKPEPHLG